MLGFGVVEQTLNGDTAENTWGKTQIYCLHYYTHSTVVVGDLISCAAPGVASCWLSDSVFSNLSL